MTEVEENKTQPSIDQSLDEESFIKNKNKILIIGDENINQKESLQNSFLKFRDQKIKERQLLKACRNTNNVRSKEFKESLRYRFIAAAERYIGVPYGIKYKREEDPIAPLYLDCCGLVRQALMDLQEDFGFVIAKWNQAYQMDTLPIALKFEELQPGDLIFYEGTYVSERSKKQKHNNVHVEIYLGGESGEATVGSRFHRGNVSLFPSYKFNSTTWTLVQYHFRSIDTWLDGVCKSHCDEHPWNNDTLAYVEAAGKRSIFCDADAESDEEDDCCAGGDEEIQLPANQHTTTDTIIINTFTTSSTTECYTGGGVDNVVTTQEPSKHEEPLLVVITEEETETSSLVLLPQMKEKYELLQSSMEETKILSPVLEKSSSIDLMKKPKRVSALRSSFNKEPLTTLASASKSKATTARSSFDGVTKSINSSCSLSSSHEFNVSKSTNKEGPKTFYIGKTNGWKLVKKALEKRGWLMMPDEYHFSTKYGLKWVERRNQIDYLAHIPGQLVCHIPNNDIITTKIGLLCTLRDKYCRSGVGSLKKIHPPWLPHTYDLESPIDRAALLQEELRLCSISNTSGTTRKKKITPPKTPVLLSMNTSIDGITQVPEVPLHSQQSKSDDTECDVAAVDDEEDDEGDAVTDIKGGIWIYKPSCANRGRGIRMVAGMEAITELCNGEAMGGGGTTTLPYKGIVQKYIKNPLLVTEEGYKFDIRVYLLIARNFPGTLAFYHPGYCRLALKPYSIATLASLEDNSIHLTNAAIQKQTSTYKEEGNKEVQIQTIAAIADNLDSLGKSDSAEYMRNDLDSEIKLCMVDVLKASSHLLLKKHGYFDLLGCDFMLSETNKLSLLEINTNPSLTLDNNTLKEMLPDIVDGAIELVLKSQGPDRRLTDPDDFLKNNNSNNNSGIPASWSLIYDESAGYTYKPKRKSKKL